MKVIKNILSIIFAFILMFLIIVTTALGLANKFIQKEFILEKFDEIDLYTQVYNEVQDKFTNYIYQSGMEPTIIDSICDREKVKSDMLIVVNSMYTGEDINVDTTSIEINLQSKVDEFIASQGRKISEQEKQNIKDFEDTIIDSYKEQFGIFEKGTTQINKYINKIENTIELANKVCIIATIVLLILLLLINIKTIKNGVNYASISMFCSGILIYLAKRLILSSVDIDNLVVYSKSISSILINIIKMYISQISHFANWYILVGIFGIVIIAILNGSKEINNDKKVNVHKEVGSSDKKVNSHKEVESSDKKLDINREEHGLQ